MTEQIARFKPGENVPGFAVSSQVLAGRFVSVTDDKTANGDYPIAHAAAGAFPFGVAEADSVANTEPATSVERRVNVVRRGAIARVVAGAELVAPEEVMVGTGGKAIPLADVDAEAATLVAGTGTAAVTLTARDAGAEGNAITLTIVNPGTNNASLTVDVDNGTDITVSLATDGTAVATSTADAVAAAIDEHDTAGSLVDAAGGGAGVVVVLAETPLAGGTDATEGRAVGRVLTDTALDEVAEVDLY